jgi:hypothetical protein
LSAQDTILTLVGILVLGIIVILANYADQHRSLRARSAVRSLLILGNILLVINGIGQVMSAYSPSLQSGNPPGKADAWGALILSVVVAGLATAVLSRAVAERIAVLFPRYRGDAESQPAAPSASDPDHPELQLAKLMSGRTNKPVGCGVSIRRRRCMSWLWCMLFICLAASSSVSFWAAG